jgi:hypothetical protein
VKRLVYVAMAALLGMLVLAPGALAQDAVPAGDDDPYLPEQNVVEVEHEELARIAGQPLPKTGGPELGAALVPAAALLLLGSGVLGYVVLRRGQEGGSVR